MYSATISRCMRRILPLALGALCAMPGSVAHPQSLDSHHPAPLQPDENNGTVDNFVGNNYFYLTGGPGSVTITVTYKSMGLLGNAQRSSLTVQLSDEKRTWVETRTISSLASSNSAKMVGNLKVPTRLILSIFPPSGGLVRSGGGQRCNGYVLERHVLGSGPRREQHERYWPRHRREGLRYRGPAAGQIGRAHV